MQVGDAAMVLSLSSLEEVEDKNLLAGSLMVLLEQDINQAQVCEQPLSIYVASASLQCTLASMVGRGRGATLVDSASPQESGHGRWCCSFGHGEEAGIAHMHAVCAAQELLLRSSRPVAALEMRQDLKHWPEALALAQRLAPDRVPALGKEHAAMLEMVGEYAEARTHYQQVLVASCLLQNTVTKHTTATSSPVSPACCQQSTPYAVLGQLQSTGNTQ
jgi:hypothetical protein